MLKAFNDDFRQTNEKINDHQMGVLIGGEINFPHADFP
jgi:hypothetical protein